MAQYIVRHAGEDRKFTYEQYEVYQEAWDRYGQLVEEDVEYVTFVSAPSDEVVQAVLRGEYDESRLGKVEKRGGGDPMIFLPNLMSSIRIKVGMVGQTFYKVTSEESYSHQHTRTRGDFSLLCRQL